MNDKKLKANSSSCNNRLCCSQCQYVSEFIHPMTEQIERDLCEQYNFICKSSIMLVSGICHACMSKTGWFSKSI